MQNRIEDINCLVETNNIYDTENSKYLFLSEDKYGRRIFIHKIRKAQLVGDSLYYPNITIYSNLDHKLYAPIKEKIMSLQTAETNEAVNISIKKTETRCDIPVFFLIYNTDNYYHFVYDTLPYLISFLYLRRRIRGIKLLMSYPNSQAKQFYKFVLEFLELLEINEGDIFLAKDAVIYNDLYISSSYTHDIDSNLPPRDEIYDFYHDIISSNKHRLTPPHYKRFYISRRTWLHNDFSNIGTNYTTRRKLENEDELVNFLVSEGFQEIFTENLSTLEKISLFAEAEIIVGAIGGGVCNVLFSSQQTKLICLISPTFLNVNYRFKYALEKVALSNITNTRHVEPGLFKKYMRISCPDQQLVGEITEVYATTVKVAYTKETVSGWNAQNTFEHIILNQSDCIPLDEGLNSAWILDMAAFKRKFKSID